MKKHNIIKIIIFILILLPINISAKSGCCSWHGGVAGCRNGRQVCRDGTLSPTCTCYSLSTSNNYTLPSTTITTIKTVYGCMDKTAKNYDPTANKQYSTSCEYYKLGCTNKIALNYNPEAEKDDGSCIFEIKGCTIYDSSNYDINANIDDGSCINKVYGCTDKTAANYNKNAYIDDGSCKTKKEGCTYKYAINYDEDATHDDDSCIFKTKFYGYKDNTNTIKENLIITELLIVIITIGLFLICAKKILKQRI